MSTLTTAPDQRQLAEKIDEIIRELEALRRQLTTSAAPESQNLAEQLFGALGHGSWDEYDLNLDWQRFNQ